jgi:hypothetical protein
MRQRAARLGRRLSHLENEHIALVLGLAKVILSLSKGGFCGLVFTKPLEIVLLRSSG